LTIRLHHANIIEQARNEVNETDFTTLNEKIWAGGPRREDLVQRVANALREQILSRKLEPGAKLIPETDLSRNLGISRPSLREAIRILAHEGLIVVKHGVGTFVGKDQKHMLGSLELMRSMTDLIRAAGGEPAQRDMEIELVKPPADVASDLELAAGSRVGRISRVRLIDDQPFVVAREYVALDDGTHSFAALKRFNGGSLYQFMRDEFDTSISHSRSRLSAVGADSRMAGLLKLRKGAPLLKMNELHYNFDGKPVMLAINHHNTEVVEFTSMRSGRPL
jgi:GntR family transcriptional regulator